jgi:RimJ/RimL family protein N-acetyltransferase
LRLELIPADRGLLERLLASDGSCLDQICSNGPEIRDFVLEVAAATLAHYAQQELRLPWLGYFARESDGGGLCGTCAFTGPPLEGVAEIAYYTFKAYEGRGVATLMAAALIEMARADGSCETLIGLTLPGETASGRVLSKLGFERDGLTVDKDAGEVWRWRKSLKARTNKLVRAPKE